MHTAYMRFSMYFTNTNTQIHVHMYIYIYTYIHFGEHVDFCLSVFNTVALGASQSLSAQIWKYPPADDPPMSGSKFWQLGLPSPQWYRGNTITTQVKPLYPIHWHGLAPNKSNRTGISSVTPGSFCFKTHHASLPEVWTVTLEQPGSPRDMVTGVGSGRTW